MKKGESAWKKSDDIVLCERKDKRDVLTISNKHSVEMVPVPNKRGHLTTKPNIVRDYNNGMSEVDRFDQMLSYYQGLRNSIRWYEKIGVDFRNIFLHNSFYLTKQKYPGSFKISLLEYCTIVSNWSLQSRCFRIAQIWKSLSKIDWCQWKEDKSLFKMQSLLSESDPSRNKIPRWKMWWYACIICCSLLFRISQCI